MIALAQARPQPARWQAPLAIAGGTVLLLALLFGRDLADMARIWWTSSTYAHCLLVPPIAAWLVWSRRHELAQLAPAGWWPGLAIVAAGALAWLCGEVGGAAIARHLGLVTMMQGAVVACLGPGVSRGVAFPLGFLLFLVPIGEGFEPPLQLVTARLAGGLLGVANIPAHVDGVFITTHAGLFEVAEACSGVKFLLAMLALGALAANIGFRAPSRRLAIVLAAAATPVLANAIRAWGTIAIAERIGAEAAGGFDHLVYGWIFFALVVALLLGVAWPFFDRPAADPAIDPVAIRQATSTMRQVSPLNAGSLSLLIAGAAMGWSAHVEARSSDPVAAIIPPQVAGWRPIGTVPGDGWRPRFAGADRGFVLTYVAGDGNRVTLARAAFAAQRRGLSVVGYGQGATRPDGGWTWMGADGPGGSRIAGPRGHVRAVLLGFRIDGIDTASAIRVKLATLRLNLLGRSSAADAWIVTADESDGGMATVRRFAAAAGLPVPSAER